MREGRSVGGKEGEGQSERCPVLHPPCTRLTPVAGCHCHHKMTTVTCILFVIRSKNFAMRNFLGSTYDPGQECGTQAWVANVRHMETQSQASVGCPRITIHTSKVGCDCSVGV